MSSCVLLYKDNREWKWGININEQLIESRKLCSGSFAVKSNENIYFSSFETESFTGTSGSLFMIDFNGNSVTKLADIPARFLTVDDDYLYLQIPVLNQNFMF